MTDRQLTDKEQKVIKEFEAAQPGLGAMVERNIRHNEVTGWADIIADTPDDELVVKEGFSSNTHVYPKINQ